MRNSRGQFTDGNNPASIPHRFTSERLKGNQYAKGNAPNATTFTTGVHTMENHKQWKSGLYKTRDGYMRTIAPRKSVPNARYVWEQVNNQQIPQGYVIYHLDGDRFNDDPANLRAITRAELIKLNHI